jgi:gliding motility associated protien GldN
MKTSINFLLVLSSLTSLTGTAQNINGGPIPVPTPGIVDGPYIPEHIPTKRLIPYEYVREADVIWSQRVWQSIDLREKINHPLYFPFDDYDASKNWVTNSTRLSLWCVLKANILSGDLRVFSPYNPYQTDLLDGDQLKYPIDPLPGANYYTDSAYRHKLFPYLGTVGQQSIIPLSTEDGVDSTRVVNGQIEYVYADRDSSWLLSKDIIAYHLKEDWFFDKERSVMDVRIIAIAPVIYNKDQDGHISGKRELFWLYFPHCRFILNNYFTYNTKNDAQWMSFDDLFWKRRFSSVIYKESNVYDRAIETYKPGVDALFEAEKIKEEMRTIEHDLWSF